MDIKAVIIILGHLGLMMLYNNENFVSNQGPILINLKSVISLRSYMIIIPESHRPETIHVERRLRPLFATFHRRRFDL